jgi:Transposase DDE domain group 1
MMNCNWFQIAMLAYNLNCWLQLFNREEGAEIGMMRYTTLATARLRFLFVAAKIWRHAGRVGVSYSDHYPDQGLFHRLMERVRGIAPGGDGFLPVLKTALT